MPAPIIPDVCIIHRLIFGLTATQLNAYKTGNTGYKLPNDWQLAPAGQTSLQHTTASAPCIVQNWTCYF